MSSGVKMRITLSTPVYGVPIPDSENPYISVPSGRAGLEAALGEKCEVRGLPRGLGLEAKISGFLERLSRGLGVDGCLSLTVRHLEGSATRLSLYSSLTSASVYALARIYGETMDPDEVLATAKLADDLGMDRSWLPLIDSVRYSSLEGAVAVYRNEEERASFPLEPPEIGVLGSYSSVEPRVSRSKLGSDAYNAIIHAMGVAVLEAALRLREGSGVAAALSDLIPVQEGIALAVWGLKPLEGDKCYWVPDMPGSFAGICLKGYGGKGGG